MLVSSPATAHFRLEIGKVANDPMSDPNLTMQLDVDLTKAEPNGTLTVRTLANGTPEVIVLQAKNDDDAAAAFTAVRDAVAGVDFLTFGRGADDSPVAPATMRWTTTDAAGAARSIVIDDQTQEFPGALALAQAGSQFVAYGFGLYDE